uniref:GUN4-like domain-containing protein n=1 Tax=Caloglossa beccarii TaxID=131038 RepID=A0A1Z1M8A4_9FLOR|nr:hypothetical protein [Caloglossa beccarii]ARW62199.1 hypothetical protein [Caloglossa beccarii]
MQKVNDDTKNQIESNYNIENEDISNFIANDYNLLTNDSSQTQEKLLITLLKSLLNQKINKLEHSIFNKLKNIKSIETKLSKIFPNGIIQFNYYIYNEYKELNELLKQKKFQEADKITQKYLLKLAHRTTINQKEWIYFTEIDLIPAYDLFVIDLLWKIYSENKFGISIQRNIWLSYNQNWNTFLEKIGWSHQGKMKRYPDEFTWDISAPKGHLPLFNQIRGNQVLLSLFQHHIWITNYYI